MPQLPHNPKVGGSNPPSATTRKPRKCLHLRGFLFLTISAIFDFCSYFAAIGHRPDTGPFPQYFMGNEPGIDLHSRLDCECEI